MNLSPKIKRVIAKSGTEIRLEFGASYLAPYWKEFSEYSPYQVEIEGEFNKILLKSRVGDRVVGAAFHGKTGAILFLPPLQHDEGTFLRDDENDKEGKQYWTKDALRFGKRLVAALSGMAVSLKQLGAATPPPSWSLAAQYRLQLENDLESALAKCVKNISVLRIEKSKLETEMSAAGALRALLFEQGKPLERAVLETMRLFGFIAEPFANGESEFDVVFSSPEGRCLGEAEGKDNKAINIDKFSQLERNLHEDFSREEVKDYAKGVLFRNAFRLLPLEERDQYFTEKCVSAAKRIGAALIRTSDLFAPAKYLKEHPTDKEYARGCRESIFAATGDVVVFPGVPVVETASLAEATREALVQLDVPKKIEG